MVKKLFLVGVMLLLASLLMVGCGVPQEEHDAVVAERDAAKVQVASLQSDLNKAQSDLAAAESDLATAQAQIETLEDDIDKAESSLGKAKSDLAAAQRQVSELRGVKTELRPLWDSLRPKLDLLNHNTHMLGLYERGAPEMEMGLAGMRLGSYIASVGNSELSEMYDEWLQLAAEMKIVESTQLFDEMCHKIIELTEADINAFETQLSK